MLGRRRIHTIIAKPAYTDREQPGKQQHLTHVREPADVQT